MSVATPGETHSLENLCHQALRLVHETAMFIAGEAGKVQSEQIEIKSLNSLVSYVDRTAERRLVAGLKALLPEAVFLTEEETVAKGNGTWQWIIDPLDGTTNFLHGLPCYAISVALRKDDEIVLGIVHEITRNESFYAWKGGGAWMNGSKISVSSTKKLKHALIATGFPYRDFARIRPYFTAFENLMKCTRGLRRFGAAAVDLAWVACGRFDGFFEYGLSPWDVAAGILLVQEAGGKVCDFNGGDRYLFGQELVASNSAIHDELMQIITQAFAVGQNP